MPLPEKRIAELILRYLLHALSPEEHRELMEGYVNLSAENRRKFEELINKNKLLNKLREWDAREKGDDPSRS